MKHRARLYCALKYVSKQVCPKRCVTNSFINAATNAHGTVHQQRSRPWLKETLVSNTVVRQQLSARHKPNGGT